MQGLELYAGWCADDARRYVRYHGLTSDDVKIVMRGEQVLVICKREVTLKGGSYGKKEES